MKINSKSLVVIMIFLVLAAFAVLNFNRKKYSETRIVMGTFVKIDVCATSFEKNKISTAYSEVWKRLEDISSRMSVFNNKSDLAKINSSFEDSVTIGADTHKLLIDSFYFTKLTQGAFDVTVLPLIKLWKGSEKSGIVPDRQKIDEVKNSVGVENFQIQAGNKIRRLNQQSRIDLGGIAKGFAVDEAARILRAKNFNNFFIDAGGDDYVSGNSCKNGCWKVGVRDPKDKAKIVDVLKLKNSAVTTSGNYERFFSVKNKKYSHIIDPKTGYPQEGVISATVIAPFAKDADALSTALCVMGPEKGIKLIDSLSKNFAAMIIFEDKNGKLSRFESKRYKNFK